MISEVDVRDWDFEKIRTDVKVSANIGGGVGEEAERRLMHFIDKVEALVLIKQPQVAALFKEKK